MDARRVFVRHRHHLTEDSAMEKPRWLLNLSSDRASVFLEYSMLFAVFAIVVCMPLVPGGPAYTFLHKELMLRIVLISLPFF